MQPDGLLASHADFCNLELFVGPDVVEHHLQKPDGKPEKRQSHHSNITNDMLLQCSWLANYQAQQPPTTSQPSSSRLTCQYQSVNDDTANEDDIIAALKAVEEKRSQHRTDYDFGEHFTTEIRGSRWTSINKSVAYDVVAAKAINSSVSNWCQEHGLNQMASFSVLRYGDHCSSVLAHFWAHRMEHLFAQSHHGGQVHPNLSEYTEPPAVAELEESLPPAAYAHARIKQIRALRLRA